MERADLQIILATDPWFGSIAPERQGLLIEHAQLKHFKKGGAIYRTGDASAALYCVIEGEVRFVTYSEKGRELLNVVFGPGNWFGYLGLIDGQERSHDAVFTGPGALLFIAARDFDALAREAPMIYRDVARLACLHLRLVFTHTARDLALTSERRLARWLLHFAGEVARGANMSRITQEELAGAVGISRQTASKILKNLESAGVLKLRYRAIEILDEPTLSVMAWGEGEFIAI